MQFDLGKLIYPLFVTEGRDLRREITSMPGVYAFSPDTLLREAGELTRLGITKILLFGIPGYKDENGTAACIKNNIVSRAVRSLKENFPGLTVMTDVCLCAYTAHGHCGVIKETEGAIDNEETLKRLSEMAVSHAASGADYVAPSAMAKGQVAAIRAALDRNGFNKTKIMGYSAKFASSFYGPFRDAALSAPKFGDRSGYQLDHRDTESALREIADDIREGADIVMVKPALCYLDIIKEARLRFNHALAAYNVSGEYAMVKAGAQAGYWKEREIVSEIIGAIKRAGADIVITYHAHDIAEWLKKEKAGSWAKERYSKKQKRYSGRLSATS